MPRASAWTLSCQPTYVPSVEVADMSSGYGYVIKVQVLFFCFG
ncbi:unnamed protein product [Camellia sinensis]